MLILTRRINECVIIDDNITVKVLCDKGNQVRLGFEAPEDVIIHRQEIAERIKANLAPVKKKTPVITYRQRSPAAFAAQTTRSSA